MSKGVANYFVNDEKDLIAQKENIIQGKKYRITLLTERLVRLEYSPNGIFEDRATQNVIYRNFERVTYSKTSSETILEIITKYFQIDYVIEGNFKSGKLTPGNTLKVTLKDTDKVWYYGHPESRNFKTIGYSLDDFKGNLKLNKGLYSTDGFAVLDDSESYVIENGSFIERPNKEIDIYLFMYKKDLGQCLQDYYALTGYPTMIPRYALGNWWYKNENYRTNEIKEVVEKFKEEKIPLSVFLLGDKWHEDNDKYKFNNQLVNSYEIGTFLKQNKIEFGLTIDMNKDNKKIPMQNAEINNYLNTDIKNLYSSGVSIFNLDYNNQLDKNNLQVLNHLHYASSEIMLNKRGVNLCRNAGISTHRYPVVFSGKTKVDFQTLDIIPFYNASASNMGISFVAHPIGGYYGGIEDDELYLRYIELATFSPIFLLSSEGGKYYKREPWRWNKSLREIVKEYMNLRNKLVPYIYTEAYIYHKSGSPIIQPLYYSYPKIYDEPRYRNQYFFGSEMLIIPITKLKNQTMNRVVQKMFIPKGTWYNLLTGKKYPGNKYYMSFFKDEDYPVFCREGSIIPLSLDNNTDNPKNMEFVIFPGCNGDYKLYEDDGISNDYKQGKFHITDLNYEYHKDNYIFRITPIDMHYNIPTNRNYTIRFKNTKVAKAEAFVENMTFPCEINIDRNDLIVKIENAPTNNKLEVRIIGQNIEVEAVNLINDDIKEIIDDLEISTSIKEKVDDIMFSDLTIKKKRIAIKKIKKAKLEPRFITMFIKLLEYLDVQTKE